MFGSLRDALRDRARVSAVAACLRELTLKPRSMDRSFRDKIIELREAQETTDGYADARMAAISFLHCWLFVNMEDEIRTTVLPVAASETVPVIRRWVEADARLKRVANPLFGAFAARLLDPPSGADAAAW